MKHSLTYRIISIFIRLLIIFGLVGFGPIYKADASDNNYVADIQPLVKTSIGANGNDSDKSSNYNEPETVNFRLPFKEGDYWNWTGGFRYDGGNHDPKNGGALDFVPMTYVSDQKKYEVNLDNWIVVPADGKVIATETNGNGVVCYVAIEHSGGYITEYRHIRDFQQPKSDNQVFAGNNLARVAKELYQCGIAPQPHLHFALRQTPYSGTYPSKSSALLDLKSPDGTPTGIKYWPVSFSGYVIKFNPDTSPMTTITKDGNPLIKCCYNTFKVPPLCPTSSTDRILLYKDKNFSCDNLLKGDGWEEIPPDGTLGSINFSPKSVRFPTKSVEENTTIQENKPYVIRSKYNNLVLDVDGFHHWEDNASIIQWEWNTGCNQIWKFVNVGAGYYRIVSTNSNKCLAVHEGFWKTANLVQYDCNLFSDPIWGPLLYGAEQWEFEPAGTPGDYFIVNRLSGKVIDIPGGMSDWGVQMIQYTKKEESNANQIWHIYESNQVTLQLQTSTGDKYFLSGDDEDLTDNLRESTSNLNAPISYQAGLTRCDLPLTQNASNPLLSLAPNDTTCNNNHPPRTPSPVSPANGSSSINQAPALVWQSKGDPDGNSIDFYVEVTQGSTIVSRGWTKEKQWSLFRLNNQYGVYWWRVKARDSFFVESPWSEYRSFSISPPNILPTIFLATANESPEATIFSNQTSWFFTGTASDPDGYLTRIDFSCSGDNCGNTYSHTNGTNWTHQQNNLAGYNEIYFVAVDNNNGSSASRRIKLFIDLANPATTLGLNGESGSMNWPEWFRGPVNVSLLATDNSTGRALSGVNRLMYRIDSGPWQSVNGSSTSFTVVSDGMHTVEYYAVDNVGNVEGNRSIQFKIDQTPPNDPANINDINGIPSDVWQNTYNIPEFTWDEAVDGLSGVWGYQLYFGKDAQGTGLVNFPVSADRQWKPQPDGVHTDTYYLRGRTRDNAGNWSDWNTWFVYRYDGTPPENPVDITHAAGIINTVWQYQANTADFSWPIPHDEGSGIQGYYLSWSSNPSDISTNLISTNSYENLTPLCETNGACVGYLRLRSVDRVGNLATEWSTAFELRYDNSPPVLDFTLNDGATQTYQTQITINLDATDEGSGLRAMRISDDGNLWSEWEAYTPERAWAIYGISRQLWPVYVQVMDWVGLTSEQEAREIYLDINIPQPKSSNYWLFDTDLAVGSGETASSSYSSRGTVGQTIDASVTASANFLLFNGYESGSQAIPLVQPLHDDFAQINGVLASGNTSDSMSSAGYQLIGVFGEFGLASQTTISSSLYQHQPGYLAAHPTRTEKTVELAPGKEPDPDPVITCESPLVQINQNEAFTNDLLVNLGICAPQVVEMRISNNADFIGATWEPYMETKPWLLSSLDVQTTPRFVYVQFRDASGTIQKSYFDDILFDPNMPSGEILVSDDVSGVNFQHTDFIPSGVSSNDLSLPGGIPVLQAEPDGSVLIYMKGYDDNSGLSEIQLSAESSFTDDEWQPFTTAMTWVPPAGDGLKTVYARMRDSAGNIGQSISMDFIYDSQPPQGGIQLEETVINAQTVEVTAHLIAFDGLFDDAFPESPAGWYEGVVQDMRIGFDPDFVDVSWQPFSENINIPIVSNSWERTIYVQYRDWAGNISEVYSATYTVDYIPPVVSATVSDGESLTRTINLKAHDNAAGIHNLRLSNDPMMSRDVLESDFTETISWDFNAERTAWIQVSDRVGNWSEPYPLYASLSDTNSCVVQETQYYSEVYGTVSITGVNAPVGTVVQAISPRDETVGCFTVTEEGNYGVMRIYGEDLLANPAIPGMHDGELVVFKVNGSPATATPLLGWSNDQVSHNVNLNAGENVFGENVFLPLIIR